MKSTSQHQFSRVPSVSIPRSSFNRSHGHKTTFDAGYLIPVYWDEVLPGDTFNLKMSAFARMSTPLWPVMDNLRLDSHFFFIPNRLIWENWTKFMGEQIDPGDSIDFPPPTLTKTTGFTEGLLGNYLGVPLAVPGLEHSSLPYRAYYKVWNEWFRDQNLQDSLPLDLDDGPDVYTDFLLQRRNKRHDYFTSGLPWPQKGDSIDIPLGTSADIVSDATTGQQFAINRGGTYYDLDSSGSQLVGTVSAGTEAYKMYADLSTATAATINQLRQSFQIQRMLERDARSGTRYIELVKAHFGVSSPDARQQRSEYLGGGSTAININPVLVTSGRDSTADKQPGDLAAFATTAINGHGFTKSFTEHGIVLGMVSVRADLSYSQGLNRAFSRETRYDYYWPSLSHIGEQVVKNKEIYAVGSGGATDEDAFCYQERYAEYRYKPSLITGKFSSQATGTLDAWHLAQEFTSLPTLSSTFIEENPPLDRVLITAGSEPHFIFDSYFDLKCARPMPLYGVPGLIDHF